MIVGVPEEIKTEERRVAITPAGVAAMVAHKHSVLIQRGAGVGSGISDRDFQQAGAKLVSKAADVWNSSEMVIKVKEPIGPEIDLLRPDLLLFTYLHLAADRDLTQRMMHSKCTGVAYETIELPDGSLPLLTPMSEVAGKLSAQVGAWCLETENGGSGVLLAGVSGVAPARVVIIGAGVSGSCACEIAVGMGALVTILDISPKRLRYIHDIHRGQVVTLMSNRANIATEVARADLLIGAVLIPGARAPKLVTREMVKSMRPGSALIDISVDQGGCIETTRATTHAEPTFVKYGVVHYCVANMPGIVPRTSTYALTNVTLSYALELADKGFGRAIAENQPLKLGVNVHQGRVTCPGVAEAFNLKLSEL
ncbi:MAG: alanine dehydrogenase [Candidatus Alcyoniella australis]|nr:alanine dehydrogenase [Candidatus Alcyoniella australis]